MRQVVGDEEQERGHSHVGAPRRDRRRGRRTTATQPSMVEVNRNRIKASGPGSKLFKAARIAANADAHGTSVPNNMMMFRTSSVGEPREIGLVWR